MKFFIASAHTLVLLVLITSITQAAIVTTGDVVQSGYLPMPKIFIGNISDGTLTIDDGSYLLNQYGYIGYEAGATGVATVTDTDSWWQIRENLYVGYYGAGQLNILDNAKVDVLSMTFVGRQAGSTGEIYFDNGILSTHSLFAHADQLTGTGTINTNGLLLDGLDLVFDATHGPQQSILLNSPGQNLTLQLDQDKSGRLGAGYQGSGTLTIQDGITVECRIGCLGYCPGSSGTATVSGTGSNWNCKGSLYVGSSGAGTLNITDGATVDAKYVTWIASNDGASGTILFDNGTLNTGTLVASPAQMSGTGTINTNGLLLEGTSLVFDASHGLQQTFTLNEPGQNITINLDQNSDGYLAAGYRGTGTLIIQDGMVVESRHGYLGYHPGSSGTATVSGAGSTWNTSVYLEVASKGSGELNITDGGVVNSSRGYIGRSLGSNGIVNVSGANSTWSSTNYGIDIGSSGTGELNITDGGTVNGYMDMIASGTDSTGTVTVSGTNSTWNAQSLRVGYGGSGKLTIADNAEVNVKSETWVAPDTTVTPNPNAVGKIHFDNGTLNTGTLGTFSDDLTGTGTINTNGLITDDVDLLFDASHGNQQTITINGPNQNLTINLTANSSGKLGAGYKGNGTLTIREGVTIISMQGHLGYYQGSTGTATVSGIGSSWITGGFYVGGQGTGELYVIDEAIVDTSSSYIGASDGSTGTATVSGNGSIWANSSNLCVGQYGVAELNIADDGFVAVTGTLTIDKDLDGDSFINMSDGGMLALAGEADDSLTEFFGLIEGTDAIRWWNPTIDDWDLLTTATAGTDYTLEYFTDGIVAGYTLLTVTAPVPEPSTIVLLLTALFVVGLVPTLKNRKH